jgi:hypothetical protein
LHAAVSLENLVVEPDRDGVIRISHAISGLE